MISFETTAGSNNRLEKIVDEASQQIVLLSPYVQLPQVLLERLRHASRRGIPITIVCREAQLGPETRLQISSLPGADLRFMEHLHAKCYMSEKGMLITSMNLYDFSIANNREMGIYISSDEQTYANANSEVRGIIDASRSAAASTERPLPNSRMASAQPSMSSHSMQVQVGYCLRCRERLDRNEKRPLCLECYQVWAQFGNLDYEESFCHACGEERVTSMSRPLCRGCYSAN